MDYPIKRQMKDLHELMKRGYNVEPTFVALGDFDFIVQFEGPKGTLYDGGSWKVRVKFPKDYPYRPPSLTFVDPIFHPNISQSGGICVNLLGRKWDAGYDLLKVFEEILPSLLVQPNAASPYNQEASDLMLADEKAYAERVKAYNHHAG